MRRSIFGRRSLRQITWEPRLDDGKPEPFWVLPYLPWVTTTRPRRSLGRRARSSGSSPLTWHPSDRSAFSQPNRSGTSSSREAELVQSSDEVTELSVRKQSP